MTSHESPTAGVTRREALRITLATSAVLVVAGCQSSGRSEFDAARSDLRKSLNRIANDDVEQQRLASIAQRIEAKARELMEDYSAFRTRFDTLSINVDVRSAQLRREVDQFNARRVTLRNDLFRVQDELRAELTADEWDRAVSALNRKAQSVGRS